MANTTNFNWETPDDTDLVKDGAAAMRTLGNSIDTSFVDLKGGTTGQILSKASNTDLDYTWVTTDDANAIQNAIVDAKGDLIAASANDTPARLAVGNNGETLVADSSTSTGLRYQSAYNGNGTINGGLDNWQRGTSFTTNGYCADRWYFFPVGVAGRTLTRQSSGLTGFNYCARVARDSGNTGTTNIGFLQSFATEEALRFAGQTATFSFYARAGANYSPTSSVLTPYIISGTGTDQNRAGANYTGETINSSSTVTLTTTWQRFTKTVTFGSTMTEFALYFEATPTGTAGANDYFEVTGVQMELGSVATTFKRAGGTFQGELAACQRYYWLVGNGANKPLGVSMTPSTTLNYCILYHPVEMRTLPTLVQSSGTAYYTLTGINYNSFTAIDTTTGKITELYVSTTGLTTGQAGLARCRVTDASIALSAEL